MNSSIHPYYARCLAVLTQRAVSWTAEQTQAVLAAQTVREADAQLNVALLSGDESAIIRACNAWGQQVVTTGRAIGAEIGA
jgi:hypothetical protein